MNEEEMDYILEFRRYCPEHKCGFCKRAAEMVERGYYDLGGTTQDGNACQKYFDTLFDEKIECKCLDDSGNTRVHSNGFRTVDNGSGYWIVECPFFEQETSKALYQRYMSSKQWHDKRSEALKKAGYRCQMCGAVINLNVHHVSYERLGAEWISDLVVLCKGCHEKLHDKK